MRLRRKQLTLPDLASIWEQTQAGKLRWKRYSWSKFRARGRWNNYEIARGFGNSPNLYVYKKWYKWGGSNWIITCFHHDVRVDNVWEFVHAQELRKTQGVPSG